MKTWFVALLLASASAAMAATPAYRCGNGSYSQTPCPGGRVVDATDGRSAAQRSEARRAAAEERRRAREMERERVAAEKAAQKAPAMASLGPSRAASAPDKTSGKPAARNKSKKGKAPQDFTAVAPSPRKP